MKFKTQIQFVRGRTRQRFWSLAISRRAEHACSSMHGPPSNRPIRRRRNPGASEKNPRFRGQRYRPLFQKNGEGRTFYKVRRRRRLTRRSAVR